MQSKKRRRKVSTIFCLAMEAEKQKVEFVANPTQRAFIESRAEADLFAARKGEGKSASLAWAAYYFTYHNPGAYGLCVRDTWENLRRTTLTEFFEWFQDGVFGHWVGVEKTWYWDKRRTGLDGKLTFMGVESKEHAQKVASMPLAYLLMDEPAPAAMSSEGIDEFVFDTAMSQFRQPGMRWYAAKLATNNPDETHWTFKRFVRPGQPPDPKASLPEKQESGYRCWQTRDPENMHNLPAGYYEAMAKRFGHRKDLLNRFVKGKFGFQSRGKAITPQWSDEIHLASGLEPIPGLPLKLGWDGGLNPTCVISQITPLGDWLIYDSFVGEGIGVYELIEDVVGPRIIERYPWCVNTPNSLQHTGDPNLDSREQSRSGRGSGAQKNSAVRVIIGELGGSWRPGPVAENERIDPLQRVLSKQREGRGILMVDRDHAEHVWFALRGGWHRRIQKNGVVGSVVKDEHSHPGDATGYLASLLFPSGKISKRKKTVEQVIGNYYNRAPGAQNRAGTSLGMAKKGMIIPPEARIILPPGQRRPGDLGRRELPLKS